MHPNKTMKIRTICLGWFCPRWFCRVLVLACLAVGCVPALAEDAPEALRPPKGTTLAIVVFEDLQCPQCGRVAPLLVQASQTYKIPLVQHDFPLPMHNWSFDAAVMARYFDTHSKEIGNEFRATVFAHQMEINSAESAGICGEVCHRSTRSGCRLWWIRTASWRGWCGRIRMWAVGLHIDHTPTIWVVSSKASGKPYVEVTDTNQLYVMIDAMKKE